MTTRNRQIEELVSKIFDVAACDARIEAARRNVDAEAVALEQWYVWFSAGKYSQAREFWFSNVEKGN